LLLPRTAALRTPNRYSSTVFLDRVGTGKCPKPADKNVCATGKGRAKQISSNAKFLQSDQPVIVDFRAEGTAMDEFSVESERGSVTDPQQRRLEFQFSA